MTISVRELKTAQIVELLKTKYPDFLSCPQEELEFSQFILNEFEKPDIIWENWAQSHTFKADKWLGYPLIYIKEAKNRTSVRKLA